MTDQIFCGVGDVPKKKKRGSMKECAEKGQVRYYGLKKVDSKLIERVLAEKKTGTGGKMKTRRLDLICDIMEIKGEIKNLNNKIGALKDKK